LTDEEWFALARKGGVNKKYIRMAKLPYTGSNIGHDLAVDKAWDYVILHAKVAQNPGEKVRIHPIHCRGMGFVPDT